MRRVATLFLVLFSLFALPPAVAADAIEERGQQPRETRDGNGFFANSRECDAWSCTDTLIYADEITMSTGAASESISVEQYTYSTPTGQLVASVSGFVATTNLMVAKNLSAASLAPTDIQLCDARRCEAVAVSAELEGIGEAVAFRSRSSDRDGTCTFTFVDSGRDQSATGAVTVDGMTMDAHGNIRSFTSTSLKRCR